MGESNAPTAGKAWSWLGGRGRAEPLHDVPGQGGPEPASGTQANDTTVNATTVDHTEDPFVAAPAGVTPTSSHTYPPPPAIDASPTHLDAIDLEQGVRFVDEPRLSAAQQVCNLLFCVGGGIYRGLLLLGAPYTVQPNIDGLVTAYVDRQADGGAERFATAFERFADDTYEECGLFLGVCALPLLGAMGSFFQVVSPAQSPPTFAFIVLTFLFSICSMLVSGLYRHLLGKLRRRGDYASWVKDMLDARGAYYMPADIVLGFPRAMAVWTIALTICSLLIFVWSWLHTNASSATITSGGSPAAPPSAQASFVWGVPTALTVVGALVVLHTLLAVLRFYRFGRPGTLLRLARRRASTTIAPAVDTVVLEATAVSVSHGSVDTTTEETFAAYDAPHLDEA